MTAIILGGAGASEMFISNILGFPSGTVRDRTEAHPFGNPGTTPRESFGASCLGTPRGRYTEKA